LAISPRQVFLSVQKVEQKIIVNKKRTP